MKNLKREKLTQARLKELFDYDPMTGHFTRKIPVGRHGRHKAGLIVGTKNTAGTKNSDGYVRIAISGTLYLASLLAWLYMEGYFPENEIDHIDRIRSNNKWDNLRNITRKCNARNCGNFSHNTSGVKGVGWNKLIKKWESHIKINRKKKNLGYYNVFDNAVCARLAAEQCLDWANCDSSSPAFKYVQKMLSGEK